MANYGEYSGAPSETQTFEYAKTILKLMTEGEPHPEGKNTLSCLMPFICSVSFSPVHSCKWFCF